MRRNQMDNQSLKKSAFFWKTFFVGLCITLIVGIVIGYGTWGKKDNKLNIKQLLAQIADRIEVLEDENANFQDQIKKMKDTVEKGKKAVQSMGVMKKELAKRQDENKRLKGEMQNYAQLQKQVETLNDLRKENESMKKALGEKAALTEQIMRLKKENEELRSTVEKVKDVIKKPTPSLQTDHPSS